MARSVLIAMSGGVDSSVAAALLREQGYDCQAAMLMMHGAEDPAEAAAVCEQLEIPFYLLDAREEFRSCTIADFISGYARGETPNPCVRCNAEVKLKVLLQEADWRGIELVATGHYARVQRAGGADKVETAGECNPLAANADCSIPETVKNCHLLFKARDKDKDQSYMLYRLKQEQLGRLLLPLGDLTKAEVRELAHKYDLAAADRGDSQDLCFVPDGDYATLIEQELGLQEPGDIVDELGRILGRHRGLIYYTVGQRKGLGLALGEPHFVLRKEKETNRIVLGKQEKLYTDSVLADNINLIALPQLTGPLAVAAQIRYRSAETAAVIRPESTAHIVAAFERKVRAPAPGQSIVFYCGEMVVGGGIIRRTVPEKTEES